jgi:hypothetical protein
MLSRVASHLYWLSRYLERAENMARILDVGASLALLSGQGDDRAASEPLVITDTLEAFAATGLARTPENVARFLAWSPDLPSSIVNCLDASRENARAVRGSITSEMWENINDTWLQLSAKRQGGVLPEGKNRSAQTATAACSPVSADGSVAVVRLSASGCSAPLSAACISVRASCRPCSQPKVWASTTARRSGWLRPSNRAAVTASPTAANECWLRLTTARASIWGRLATPGRCGPEARAWSCRWGVSRP